MLRFLFDYISPYAYLAWTQIHALAAPHGITVEPVPVLFAGLLQAHGHKGPAEIPPKRIYVMKDALRIGARLGIPVAPPPSHPFNPLLALRATALVEDPAVARRLIDGLYAAVWGGGPGVTDPTEVARIAAAAGLDGPELVARAQGDEAKAKVRRNTDQAILAGAWGVPTMIASRSGADSGSDKSELFWGYDSFPHLERWLRGDDPLDRERERERLRAWVEIKPSAVRRT
jgi:2-hydroxychromene-2-carboxylate isomerase